MCAPSFFCNHTKVIFAKESIAYIIEVVSHRSMLTCVTVGVSARIGRCERAYRSK